MGVLAARSQARFAAAREAGKFKAEITGIEIKTRKGTEIFDADEAPRSDTTVETLARLKPAFRKEGTITAGDAPGLNSAAAAMIVADRAFAESAGIEPLARLAGWGVGAVEPGMFGPGPVPAVKRALAKAGWRLGDIERIEINEAFAAVPLAVIKELGLLEDIVNVEGGAVACRKASSRCASVAVRASRWPSRRSEREAPANRNGPACGGASWHAGRAQKWASISTMPISLWFTYSFSPSPIS